MQNVFDTRHNVIFVCLRKLSMNTFHIFYPCIIMRNNILMDIFMEKKLTSCLSECNLYGADFSASWITLTS